MIELIVALLVIGSALVVFSPVLAGRTRPGVSAPKRDTRELEEHRTVLRERKHRLLRSLKELAAERGAGRVTDQDYAALRERDQADAARIIQELESVEADLKSGRRSSKRQALEAAAPPAPARQRAARVAMWTGGVLAFGAVLALTMSRAITPREPGGSITGTIPGGSDPPPTSGGMFLPTVNPARLSELERAVGADSSNVAALLEAGHLYLGERRLDEAARVTVRALELEPEAPEGFAHLAVLLFAEASSHEDPDSARTALSAAVDAVNHALKLKPDLAEGWLFKGMILMAGMRDRKGAVGAWEQYLAVAPPGADTLRIHAIVEAERRSGTVQ